MHRQLITYIVFAVLLTCTVGAEVSAAAKADGAVFKKCLECHADVREQLLEKAAHKPFKSMACSSCHNPHAGKFENLVKEELSALCRRCHGDEKALREKKRNHKPFGEGDCLSCHEPHASNNRKLLKAKGQELCFGCHARKGSFAKKNKHAPVKKGDCLRCHSAHTSDFESLAKKGPKRLCGSCHGVANGKTQNSHLGYPVQGTDCMSCHSPHGSDKKGLVKSTLHKPFSQKKCRTCHQGLQSSGNPLELKTADTSLCVDCHGPTQEDFKKVNSHVDQGIFCVNCHSPHASDVSSLMKGREAKVCFGCHEDTRTAMDRKDMGFKHPLVKEGTCTPCHRPHGTDLALFFGDNEFKVCTACHERHAKFTHPIGKDAIDPRSKRDIACITCHNLMGSPFEFALRFDRTKQLCIQCHKGY